MIVFLRNITCRQHEFLKLEVLQVKLNLAVCETSQVGSHLLLIAGTVAPLRQVASHLIGSQLHQFFTLRSRLHVLQFVEDFKHHGSIVAHRDSRHRIIHRIGSFGNILSLLHGIGIVDIELETAHDGEMVPEFAMMVLGICTIRKHVVHDGDNRLRTMLALSTVFDGDGMIDHILNLPAIFRQDQLFALGIVI